MEKFIKVLIAVSFQIIDQTYITRRFFAEAIANQVKLESSS
jgi:hypothetical protein